MLLRKFAINGEFLQDGLEPVELVVSNLGCWEIAAEKALTRAEAPTRKATAGFNHGWAQMNADERRKAGFRCAD